MKRQFRIIRILCLAAVFTGAEASTLSAEMQDKLQRVAQLEQQRKACPKGTAGSACREALDIRIKQLKEEVKEQVEAFKRKHGLMP